MFGLAPLPRTLEAALRDIVHKKDDVRASAVTDLGRLAADVEHREQALGALVRALDHDASMRVRAEAAVALADAVATEQLPALIRASQSPAERVRQMALVAIAELASAGDMEALAAIEPAIDDEAPSLRFQGLIAVLRVSPVRAERAILDALDDDDEQIRYLAVRLVEERWLDETGGPLEDRVVKRVERRLEDRVARVRLAAAILLGRAGKTSGLGEIARALNESKRLDDVDDEDTAIEMVGALGIEEARPGLERRAFGWLGVRRDGFAWHSRVALARMGDARATSSIERGLTALSRDTRTFAVAAAGAARLTSLRDRIAGMRGDESRADPQAVEDALALLEA